MPEYSVGNEFLNCHFYRVDSLIQTLFIETDDVLITRLRQILFMETVYFFDTVPILFDISNLWFPMHVG